MRPRSTLMIAAGAALALAFTVLAQNASDAPARNSEPNPTIEMLAPIEQGNNKADLAATARIYKEINAANNLSESAKNVKVITNAGKVTLLGPVDTAKDKRLIGEIAVRWASPGNVDNQLEVKVVAVSEVLP